MSIVISIAAVPFAESENGIVGSTRISGSRLDHIRRLFGDGRPGNSAMTPAGHGSGGTAAGNDIVENHALLLAPGGYFRTDSRREARSEPM
ncbi:hypothetical protein NKH57_20360 [Mesorhizobium sp. M1050]|uniref:hypothetical protein n=1 Tax=unclassified Mesorhizobium TaxID=325217 RepID=UPI0003CE47B0|nr:hypothetical protein [Mesorhizobium sp. LNHC252B00]ESY71277.1 hypothetical protein X743_21900 [Mesorhizobium sp. LNHC252B00]